MEWSCWNCTHGAKCNLLAGYLAGLNNVLVGDFNHHATTKRGYSLCATYHTSVYSGKGIATRLPGADAEVNISYHDRVRNYKSWGMISLKLVTQKLLQNCRGRRKTSQVAYLTKLCCWGLWIQTNTCSYLASPISCWGSLLNMTPPEQKDAVFPVCLFVEKNFFRHMFSCYNCFLSNWRVRPD